MEDQFEIALLVAPGLETLLADEVREAGFPEPAIEVGAVIVRGGWPDVWKANLTLRGANRILIRVAHFHAEHLSQLDKACRKLPWGEWFPSGTTFRVEATCRKSKIYHTGAVVERVAKGVCGAVNGTLDTASGHLVMARIEKNQCTISIDTSGELLHKRGFKQAVAKAPMRETMAALFLRACEYRGNQPFIDPMCGSGTFPIEAAEMSLGLLPGRVRHFEFERLCAFDEKVFRDLKQALVISEDMEVPKIFGFDKNSAAIHSSQNNAMRAGVGEVIHFAQQPVSLLKNPDTEPGLILVNPPYGTRIGDMRQLRAVYETFGRVVIGQFPDWHVGLVTSEPRLAEATGLGLRPLGEAVPHGPIRIRLFSNVKPPAKR